MERERVAVMLESNCRRLPAAAFRGLAKTDSSAAFRCLFNVSKSSLRINTSPRTSNNVGSACLALRNARGIARIVFKFWVMFSPVVPSPRVEPFTKRPCSYTNSTASPSSLGSAIYSMTCSSPSLRIKRSWKANSSAESMALAKDIIGRRCW